MSISDGRLAKYHNNPRVGKSEKVFFLRYSRSGEVAETSLRKMSAPWEKNAHFYKDFLLKCEKTSEMVSLVGELQVGSMSAFLQNPILDDFQNRRGRANIPTGRSAPIFLWKSSFFEENLCFWAKSIAFFVKIFAFFTLVFDGLVGPRSPAGASLRKMSAPWEGFGRNEKESCGPQSPSKKTGFCASPPQMVAKLMAKTMAAKMMAKWRDFGVQLASNWRVALVLEARHGVLEAWTWFFLWKSWFFTEK